MKLILIFVLLLQFSIFVTSHAVPSFTRQMGMSCNSCHSQNGFPALNAFGRDFKAGGFTMMGTQKTIQEDHPKKNFLSIPDTLNTSIITKIRVLKSSATKTTLEFPDELAVVVAGRVGEHMGTFLEIGYDSEEDKFVAANFKLPITYRFNSYILGVVPYRTDGFGPAASFEVMNTGAVKGTRILEEKKVISAQQYIGTASKAEGLGFYIYNKNWHIVYSSWIPEQGSVSNITPANYIRIALTPALITGWDIGFGGQIWSGTAKYDIGEGLVKKKVNAYAADFQIMGSLGDVPLSMFATYASAENDPISLYNTGTKSKKAITVLGEVAVIPSQLLIATGYRNADKGTAINSSDDAVILAIKYFIARNIQFQLNYTNLMDNANDKNHFLFMLHTAF